MASNTEQTIIKTVEKWVNDFIVAHNICPFAKKEMLENNMRYLVVMHKDSETTLQKLMAECDYLEKHPQYKTSLFIIKQGFDNFEMFWELVEIANRLLDAQGYEGIYQLASFHPKYQFANTQTDDIGNYTNKAPYPIIHILRESSIEAALLNYKSPSSIPENNIKKMQSLGEEKLKEILNTGLNKG